ncbi:MAG: DMT family transporter [Fulvimarina manganoxydans]|uniref:DMT family transporter n=1 Tax=Fulvimarina manganoxydans TaxID=937218 RepID=UPI0023545A8E|nr:DMT family transporter [Fulvimarina manganoxydans]MCK5932103.1 DMT family transporter [Fulvimarina manganoxydans]
MTKPTTPLHARTIVNTPAEVMVGIAYLAVSFMIFPAADATGKVLVEWHGLSGGFVAFVRMVMQVALILPIVLVWKGKAALATGHLGLNLLRGIFLGLGGIAFFSALGFMPLADATAVFMVEPMMVTLLAVPILGETIGRRRIAAIVIGFAGAMLIIQPSYAVFGLASLLPVAAALLISLYLILSRFVSGTTNPLAMMVYSGLGGALTCGVALMIGGVSGVPALDPTPPESLTPYGLIVLLGLIGTVSHLMVIEAYRRAPASVLAPFSYLEIVSAVVLGFLIFGDFPNGLKWLGMAVVVGSGLALYLLELRASRRARPIHPTP